MSKSKTENLKGNPHSRLPGLKVEMNKVKKNYTCIAPDEHSKDGPRR